MRLALALGRTARELGDALSADEWLEWQVFQMEEPLGEMRADMRIANVATILANAHRGHHPPFSPLDFMFAPERRQRTRDRFADESPLDMARAWGAKVP